MSRFRINRQTEYSRESYEPLYPPAIGQIVPIQFFYNDCFDVK